jgi:pyruvate dehydrogenase E2 component (dihydrolipoamide acetyltransferase)
MTTLTLTMPRLGETMEEGVVTNWLVSAGQNFRRGDPLVEIETDKTLVEFPALGDGTMLEALADPDSRLSVGEPIARIAPVDPKDWNESESPDTVPVPVPIPGDVEPVPGPLHEWGPGMAAPSGRIRATPLARRVARLAGLDLRYVPGTGRRRRIERHDVEAAMETAGTGSRHSPFDPGSSSVLLVHGFAGDGRTWNRLSSLLQRDGTHVSAPDLPGHGTSAQPARSVEDLVAAMEQHAGGLGGPLHLVGHSLGGAVATLLAMRMRRRVASLTLLAPAGIGREIALPFIEGMANLSGVGELEHLLHYLGAYGSRLSPQALADMADELGRGRLRELASMVSGPLGQRISILRPLESLAVDLPVRVVFGLQDRVIPYAHTAALPPDVAVHYVGEAGHMMHWDAPETVARLIRKGVFAHGG